MQSVKAYLYHIRFKYKILFVLYSKQAHYQYLPKFASVQHYNQTCCNQLYELNSSNKKQPKQNSLVKIKPKTSYRKIFSNILVLLLQRAVRILYMHRLTHDVTCSVNCLTFKKMASGLLFAISKNLGCNLLHPTHHGEKYFTTTSLCGLF